MAVKKGPWTPEEDIILVTYIQENGPGNWKSVPTNTGLSRCSKSCRLRWTNYLRPGINRGNFTHHEDNLILHLQALLGNRWAAIASYVPERTDNDIKNYWNTHLKKRFICTSKLHHQDQHLLAAPASCSSTSIKGLWERRLQTDINMAKQALHQALYMDTPTFIYHPAPDHSNLHPPPPSSSTNTTTTTTTTSSHTGASTPFTSTPPASTTTLYPSSTENISRLLQNWTRKLPPNNNNNNYNYSAAAAAQSTTTTSSCDGTTATFAANNNNNNNNNNNYYNNNNNNNNNNIVSPAAECKLQSAEPLFPPLSLLETWLLFDETSTSTSTSSSSYVGGDQDHIIFDHMASIYSSV